MIRRLALVLAIASAAQVARAQRVTGVVRDSASKAPLPGAVVAALDARGNSLARALTDAAGRYSAPLADSATRLRIVRIGFQPRVITLAQPHPATLDVEMAHVPTLLSTVTVIDERLCSARGDRAEALALWEQARAGLLTSIVAREAKPAAVTMLGYERTIDEKLRRVVRQKSRRISGRSTQPFVAPVSPAGLAENGYLSTVNGDRVFGAPDADVLLDETFAATHCFSVSRADAEHPGQVGIAFEPVRGRDRITDVRGTLWLDASIPALRTIEFGYTGGDAADVLGTAKGMIHFRTMANGVVFVDDWYVRVPVMRQDFTPGRTARADRGMQRGMATTDLKPTDQFQETGGLVQHARWPDGESWTAAVEAVSGYVVDEQTKKPMRDALVAVEATGDTVTADSLGRWAIFPLFPGRYEVAALDTSYSAFVSPRARKSVIEVAFPQQGEASLTLPGRMAALKDQCGDTRGPGERALLLGRVVDVEGRKSLPIPKGTVIRASWLSSATMLNTTKRTLAVQRDGGDIELDDHARFPICDVPRDVVLHLAMIREGVVFRDTSLVVPRGQEIRELTWRVNLAALARVVAQAPGTFRGRVTDRSKQTPLADVDVWLPAIDKHAMTDSSGAFAFDGVAAGEMLVQVRRIGYEVRRDTLRITAGSRIEREYALMSLGVQLDTVRTVADAVKYISPGLRGFEERRSNKASGYFIPESELRKFDDKSLASIILTRVSGMRMIPGMHGAAYLASSTKEVAGTVLNPSTKPCFITVYVDGTLIYNATADAANDPPNFQAMAVNQYAGVEFYPRSGTGPPGYNATGSGCGTLLLWTREK